MIEPSPEPIIDVYSDEEKNEKQTTSKNSNSNTNKTQDKPPPEISTHLEHELDQGDHDDIIEHIESHKGPCTPPNMPEHLDLAKGPQTPEDPMDSYDPCNPTESPELSPGGDDGEILLHSGWFTSINRVIKLDYFNRLIKISKMRKF